MSSRLVAPVVVVVTVLVTAAPAAAAPLTKPEVIKRSAEICRHADDVMAKHVRRFFRALAQQKWPAVVRHGRRWVRAGLRHVTRIRRLREPRPGNFWFERYLDRSRGMFGWANLAADAFGGRRLRLADRRNDRAVRHRRRAKKAAREYGLKPACTKFLGD